MTTSSKASQKQIADTIITFSAEICTDDGRNEKNNSLKAQATVILATTALPQAKLLKKEFNAQAALTKKIVKAVLDYQGTIAQNSGFSMGAPFASFTPEKYFSPDDAAYYRAIVQPMETDLAKLFGDFAALKVTQDSPAATKVLHTALKSLEPGHSPVYNNPLADVAKVISAYKV